MAKNICTRRSFCARLEEKLNPLANHGKGLTLLVVTSFRSGKQRKIGVYYKTSEKDRGLMVTFCPWCGENLLQIFKLSGIGEEKKSKAPTMDYVHAP